MEKKNKKKEKVSLAKKISQVVMCGPITIWSVLFIIAPVLLLLFMSFMTKGPLGAIQYKFTLENYAAMLDPVYLSVVKESIVVAFVTTFLCI